MGEKKNVSWRWWMTWELPKNKASKHQTSDDLLYQRSHSLPPWLPYIRKGIWQTKNSNVYSKYFKKCFFVIFDGSYHANVCNLRVNQCLLFFWGHWSEVKHHDLQLNSGCIGSNFYCVTSEQTFSKNDVGSTFPRYFDSTL